MRLEMSLLDKSTIGGNDCDCHAGHDGWSSRAWNARRLCDAHDDPAYGNGGRIGHRSLPAAGLVSVGMEVNVRPRVYPRVQLRGTIPPLQAVVPRTFHLEWRGLVLPRSCPSRSECSDLDLSGNLASASTDKVASLIAGVEPDPAPKWGCQRRKRWLIRKTMAPAISTMPLRSSKVMSRSGSAQIR
jgi:hypothetical protein